MRDGYLPRIVFSRLFNAVMRSFIFSPSGARAVRFFGAVAGTVVGRDAPGLVT